jgi:YbbR domain-containing protein
MSVVENIRNVAAQRFDVSGATDTLRRITDVVVGTRGVTVRPAAVEVTVPIEPRVLREFRALPVTVLRSEAVKSVRVYPESATVVISGPKSQIDLVSPSDITVRIDARRMDAGQFLIAPTVTAAKRLRITSVQPDRFQVVLEPFAEKR